MIKLIVPLFAAAAVAGCATTAVEVAETGEPVPASEIRPYTAWPDALPGRTVRIETQTGVVNVVNFAPSGRMSIQVDPGGPVVDGYYGFRGENLCINFAPRGEECWRYTPLVEGQTVTTTSNRGQTLRVTMLKR